MLSCASSPIAQQRPADLSLDRTEDWVQAIVLVNVSIGLRANGCNIVDQQFPTLLDVTCCVRLHTLLHVVGCCCAKFETGQTFRPVQTDATLLAYNSQHCWELLRPFARSLRVF